MGEKVAMQDTFCFDEPGAIVELGPIGRIVRLSLGGFTVATAVPAFAYLVVGVLCSINALRARRVHCYFMGP